MRLGYQVVRIVQKFMRAQNYRTTLSAHGQEDSEMAFMSRIIRGRAGRDIKHLALMIRCVSQSSSFHRARSTCELNVTFFIANYAMIS